ncbi:MAG: hypothetical protein SH818_15770, partial [Saprospiraceae bacterium]|nr:hypothetical protein [Saprospiraceae bacterium]
PLKVDRSHWVGRKSQLLTKSMVGLSATDREELCLVSRSSLKDATTGSSILLNDTVQLPDLRSCRKRIQYE